MQRVNGWRAAAQGIAVGAIGSKGQSAVVWSSTAAAEAVVAAAAAAAGAGPGARVVRVWGSWGPMGPAKHLP